MTFFGVAFIMSLLLLFIRIDNNNSFRNDKLISVQLQEYIPKLTDSFYTGKNVKYF